MSDEVWRPLGVETEDEIAEYDALHDGVPDWMVAQFWAWVRKALTVYLGLGSTAMLDFDLAERMCQTLRIPLHDFRKDADHPQVGKEQLNEAIEVLRKHEAPLQIADYLLAFEGNGDPDELDALLERSKSAWTVGVRCGRPGLMRRVPSGVQVAADSVMERGERAGVRLAKAWEVLYGLDSNPSEAYRLAVCSVEDAAIPVVSPKNSRATLGTVLKQIEDQKDWKLPMEREDDRAPSGEVLIGMIRMLWHGQHDRHGGQRSAPGNVSLEEATVAVSLAVTLVHWFSAGLVDRGA